MPMYDFRCTKCEHVFEDIIPSDAKPPVCPECASESERLMSSPMTVLKRMSKKGEKYAAMHKKKGTKPFKA
jgi:putative FmdB family regulatory protein